MRLREGGGLVHHRVSRNARAAGPSETRESYGRSSPAGAAFFRQRVAMAANLERHVRLPASGDRVAAHEPDRLPALGQNQRDRCPGKTRSLSAHSGLVRLAGLPLRLGQRGLGRSLGVCRLADVRPGTVCPDDRRRSGRGGPVLGGSGCPLQPHPAARRHGTHPRTGPRTLSGPGPPAQAPGWPTDPPRGGATTNTTPASHNNRFWGWQARSATHWASVCRCC